VESERRLRQHSWVLADLANHGAIAQGDVIAAFRAIALNAAKALEVERVSVWLYGDDATKLQRVDLYERSKQRHSSGRERNLADYPKYSQALALEVRAREQVLAVCVDGYMAKPVSLKELVSAIAQHLSTSN
jgi:CheY-like chemotaxis protein